MCIQVILGEHDELEIKMYKAANFFSVFNLCRNILVTKNLSKKIFKNFFCLKIKQFCIHLPKKFTFFGQKMFFSLNRVLHAFNDAPLVRKETSKSRCNRVYGRVLCF